MKKLIVYVIFIMFFWGGSSAVGSTQQIQVLDIIFSTWESRFTANQKLSKKSNKSIYTIPQAELAYQKKRIAELRKTDPANADKLLERYQDLEKQNNSWAKKKQANNEAPRPYPQAKMKNQSLEKKMKKLLKNRGVKVTDLVITDKDWWVQPGEFRYLNTAVMSNDKKGKYWLNVSFRQIKTFSGYTPIQIWDLKKGARIRLP